MDFAWYIGFPALFMLMGMYTEFERRKSLDSPFEQCWKFVTQPLDSWILWLIVLCKGIGEIYG